MASEIKAKLESRRPSTFHARIFLDGLQLDQINTYDLRVIDRLTSHRDMHSLAWKDQYKTETKTERNQATVDRYYKQMRPVDLSRFNTTPSCRDALCAAESIFGKDRGRQILWASLTYGVNLSPYSHLHADKNGFSEKQMCALLIALSAMPEDLRAESFKNFGFFRFRRGYTLAAYADGTTIANAEGAVFDAIEKADFSKMIFVFVHELGHRAAQRGGVALDESEEWTRATSGPEVISAFAKTNLREDFAESFALYRLDSATLKKLSPERYEFMKDRAFRGLVFDADLCTR